MDIKFAYKYEGKSYFGDIYRPIAKVSLQSPKLATRTDVWMVVDTGADFTILPRYVAKDLGIDLETDCIVDTTKGVGGEQTIHLFKRNIKAQIGNFTRVVPIAFFNSDDLPPLLGRLGFIETFDTEFLRSRKVVFKS